MISSLYYKIAKYEKKFITCLDSNKLKLYDQKINHYKKMLKQIGGNGEGKNGKIELEDNALLEMKNKIEKVSDAHDQNLTKILNSLADIKTIYTKNIEEIKEASQVIKRVNKSVPKTGTIEKMITKLQEIDKTIKRVDVNGIIGQINFVTGLLGIQSPVISTNVDFLYFCPNKFLTNNVFNKINTILAPIANNLIPNTGDEILLNSWINSVKNSTEMKFFNNYDIMNSAFKSLDTGDDNVTNVLFGNINNLFDKGSNDIKNIIMYIFWFNKDTINNFVKNRTSPNKFPLTKKIYNELIQKFTHVPLNRSTEDFAKWI